MSSHWYQNKKDPIETEAQLHIGMSPASYAGGQQFESRQGTIF